MSASRKRYERTGKYLYKIIRPVWRIVARNRPRCRVLLIDGTRVLLVRNWLGSQRWRLPGGGRKSHETPGQAVLRELDEELNLKLSEDQLQFMGSKSIKDTSAQILAEFFVVDASGLTPKLNPREIIEMQWFELDELPETYSPVVDYAIGLYRDRTSNHGHKT